MNQKERVLKYMQDFGKISPFAAFRDLGITKLATRIGELRRDGVDIKQEWKVSKNRYNEKMRYMTYWVEDQKN